MASPKRRIDGLPVVDVKTDLAFRVTPADIKVSQQKSCDMCAGAVAICRTLKVKEVQLYLSRTLVRQPDRWDRYVTPMALRTEIVCFDRTGKFAPGDYRLGAPAASQKLGYKIGQPRSKRTK